MEPQFYHQPRPSAAGLFHAKAVPVFGGRAYVPERLERQHHVHAADQTQVRRTSFSVPSRDLHSPLQIAADSLMIVGLSLLAGIGFQLIVYGEYGPIVDFAYTGVTVSLFFAGIGRLMAGHRLVTLTTSFDRIRDAAEVWTLAFAALVFVLFALKTSSEVSRGAILSFYLIGLPVMAAWRVFMPVVLSPLANKAGSASHECILIGDSADPLLDKFAEELIASGYPAPTILKFGAGCASVNWPHELNDLVKRAICAAHDLHQGEVYLCAGSIASDRLMAIGRALSVVPRAIYIVPDAQTASLVRCKPASVGSHVAVEVRCEPMGQVQRTVKRLTDIAIAGSALAFLSPFLLLVAAAIKIESKGPVLFQQTRNGYRGRPFKILKFRSMRVLEDGPVIRQACRDDPRITCTGRILRKFSIDELPQLINILMGEMSLVGPRPHAQAHDELYTRSIENYEVRQHVKPGLTGWAQVNGLRGETATLDLMYRRIEYDLWYAVNASLLLDFEILLRTFIEVFRHRNAY